MESKHLSIVIEKLLRRFGSSNSGIISNCKCYEIVPSLISKLPIVFRRNWNDKTEKNSSASRAEKHF